uniref:Uncharacterized protein n=2 Tax=Oryza nivara TaxID=4536 RepID=A0A0E0J0N0_ORYNI
MEDAGTGSGEAWWRMQDGAVLERRARGDVRMRSASGGKRTVWSCTKSKPHFINGIGSSVSDLGKHRTCPCLRMAPLCQSPRRLDLLTVKDGMDPNGSAFEERAPFRDITNISSDARAGSTTSTKLQRNTKRTLELCFCAKNVDPTADLKKYIEDLEECLDRSSKFYAVAVNNTFMKQDRVYFTKEFSKDYLKPLMDGKETISIGVQMAGGVSKNMMLQMSTDDRCNLKKVWAKFATRNHIYLQSLFTFHFNKTTRLDATFDVLLPASLLRFTSKTEVWLVEWSTTSFFLRPNI